MQSKKTQAPNFSHPFFTKQFQSKPLTTISNKHRTFQYVSSWSWKKWLPKRDWNRQTRFVRLREKFAKKQSLENTAEKPCAIDCVEKHSTWKHRQRKRGNNFWAWKPIKCEYKSFRGFHNFLEDERFIRSENRTSSIATALSNEKESETKSG